MPDGCDLGEMLSQSGNELGIELGEMFSQSGNESSKISMRRGRA